MANWHPIYIIYVYIYIYIWLIRDDNNINAIYQFIAKGNMEKLTLFPSSQI